MTDPSPLRDDELWNLAEPLPPLPKPRRFKDPGRKLLDCRRGPTNALFVLQSGIPWEDLPKAIGGDSGMSC